MHPIIMKLGPFTVYSYGLMVALGFAIAAFLIYRKAPKFGLDRNQMIDLLILMLISGIIGARLLYIILNLEYYFAHPAEVFNLSRGGLIWYGSFFGGLAAVLWYMKKKSIDFWQAADMASPYIALAQGVGRIGCFLNGCCFGVEAPAGYPLAVVFPGSCSPVHPTQLYACLALISIFIILAKWQERRRFKGEIFLGYCLLYSTQRFFIEFLRGDNPKVAFGMTMSQFFSILLFTAAAVIFARRISTWKKGNTGLR
ncbi:MAG: prolipoprotein diacylglyceryl transferase [Candidatus Omnitrophica bacterium]|nr:prolipoprotein diacylglyceryl transferase [Candidatus Omnitrophota bacterium]